MQQKATFLQRLFARIIDGILLSILITVCYYLFKDLDSIENSHIQSDVTGIGVLIRWLLYYPIMEANGGTIGKRVVKIKTVSADTNMNPSLLQSYKRTVYLLLPFIASLAVLVLATKLFKVEVNVLNYTAFVVIIQTLWMIIAPMIVIDGYRMHDKFAGMNVIK